MAFRVLRHRESDFSAEARPEPLMHIASRANDALGKLDADLRAGGFGPNSRGLARELYASFTATAVGVKGTEDEAIAWGIGRALAIDLDTAGARRGALALLRGLIAFGASHADPRILERLKRTEEAIDPKMASRRRGEEKARKVPDRPTAGPGPSVQDPPLRPANRETSSPKPPTLESDIGKAPGRPWRVWRVKPSAPSGNASPQSLSDPAGGAGGTKPAAVPDPAGTSRPLLDRTNEAANAAVSAVVAEPQPVAPVLRTKSPTPIPETPLTELEKASETRPAVVSDPAEVRWPPLEQADQAADVARRTKAAEPESIATPPEPAAPALETESPTAIPETLRALAPDPAETSWPPLDRTDQAADAMRREVVAEPEPAAPARQAESPAPIQETPPNELGGESETGPAAAPDAAEISWPPLDRTDQAADAVRREVVAEPEPVAPARQAESPAPIPETPPNELGGESEPGPAAAPDPAETSWPPLDGRDEAANAAPRAMVAEPEPVAPALEMESRAPIPETPPSEWGAASKTGPAAAPDPTGTSWPPLDRRGEAADAARRAMVAESESVAAARQTESPTPIAETPPAVAPGSTETSWPPLDGRDEAANAARRAVVAEPEPVAPALEIESPTPIQETPLTELGAASETGPAAAPDPTGTSWPPLDRRGEATDAARRAMAAESEPAAPALEAESPAPIPETPSTEIHFGPEPDPKPYGQRDEEQWRSGEEGGCDYMDREEPRLVHADHKLFVEKGLRIAPDERPVLASARPRSRRGGVLLVWAVAAMAGIVLYLLISHDRSFLQQPVAMLTRIATSLTDPTAPPKNASSGAAAAWTAAGTDGDAPEKVPSPGSGRLLSSEEVRYCVFQGRRLGYLRSQVTSNASVQRFNELVTDFNSRCSHFRFENKALQAALELAAARQVQLKADTAKILASWPPNEVGVLIDLQKYDGAFAVQARLKKLGYYHHTVDGVWGPMSADALSNFRRQTALGADGTWDLATQSALLGR
jgi:Putative peptidoglycan binding domain